MIIYSIYKATNIINGKIYIGFTKNFIQRKYAHHSLSKNAKSIFHKAIKKYGKNNFIWEIIYQSKDEEHTKSVMEQYFIDEHTSMIPYGYNTCKGGGGGILHEKTLYRMIHDNPMKRLRVNSSSFKKGHIPIVYADTNEKKRLTKLGKNNPNYGKKGCWNHINDTKLTCVYCGTYTTIGNIKRWHNEKCKNKCVSS